MNTRRLLEGIRFVKTGILLDLDLKKNKHATVACIDIATVDLDGKYAEIKLVMRDKKKQGFLRSV